MQSATHTIESKSSKRTAERTVLRLPAFGAAWLLVGAVVLTGPVSAQTPEYGAGFTLGATHVESLNPGATVSNGDPVELEPGLGFAFGMHLDRWYGAETMVGVRFQGSYQQTELPWSSGDRDINVVAGDVSVLVRPIAPEPDESLIPYLTVGLGGVWYDMGRGPQTNFAPADAYYDGSSRIMPALLGGLGLDILLPPSLGWDGHPVRVRLEAADQMTLNSPLKQLSESSRYGEIHHLRFTIGAYSAVSLFGQ